MSAPTTRDDPANRAAEFRGLLQRIHAHGLRALIDFVPNHVARSHRSTVRPELSFGVADDRSKFFAPENNFFHLAGQPLQLPTVRDGRPISPTCQVLGTCDGRFEPEREHARVTGNNVTSASPSLHDWYETVKLNYGFDFTTGARAFPHAEAPDLPIPDTWWKMDRVLAHWQGTGVDGFRCDMAHLIPLEFWRWAISRARVRSPDVFFVAEAYDNDPRRFPAGRPGM
jgi:glycosidase